MLFLDDYAFSILAFIDVYQITFDEQWLDAALQMTEYAIAHFSDDENAFFYYTSDLDPPIGCPQNEIDRQCHSREQ